MYHPLADNNKDALNLKVKFRTQQSGFTLTEIMIAMALLGILAAVGLSAYNDYLIRARVLELIETTHIAKSAVTEYRISKGSMPTSNAIAGISNVVTNYVSSMRVGNRGIITVTANGQNLGTNQALNITLTPTYANGKVTWVCSSSGTTQYVPATCR
ncbi:MAG: pilin [Proteobacteria bacterium]|nr:pilin [Pseudomonadota bacterium]